MKQTGKLHTAAKIKTQDYKIEPNKNRPTKHSCKTRTKSNYFM